MSFDSLFTDILFKNGVPNTNSNSKLWISLNTKLPLKNTYNTIATGDIASFFIVKKFNQNDSNIIINNINTNNIIFDNNGNIFIPDASRNKLFSYTNILTNKPFNISSNTGEDSVLINNPTNPSFIPSKNRYWILYTSNNIVYILYNPLFRETFKNYYKNLKDKTTVSPLLQKYCEITAGTQSFGSRKFGDQLCNCLIPSETINEIAGTSYSPNDIKLAAPKSFAGIVGQRASCMSSSTCFNYDNSKTSLENSFFPDYVQNLIMNIGGAVDPVTKLYNCPPSDNTFCNQVINSAGNINISNTKLGQDCGNTKPDDTKPDDTKPDDTKPDDTKPDDTKPDDTKPDDTKPDDTKPDDTKPDDNTKFSTKTIVIISTSIILLLSLSLILYYF